MVAVEDFIDVGNILGKSWVSLSRTYCGKMSFYALHSLTLVTPWVIKMPAPDEDSESDGSPEIMWRDWLGA